MLFDQLCDPAEDFMDLGPVGVVKQDHLAYQLLVWLAEAV